jgi:tetratricopeptide (TPR) repeat protein
VVATGVATTTPIATLTPMPPTLAPSATANSVASAPLPTVASSVARPATARLFGFVHAQQTWNNCGPANITMGLTYFGWKEDQKYAEGYIRGGREDKNVSPFELVNFVNTRSGGRMELLKQLIANQFPVIVETGYMPEGYDWLGHYRTVVGYDDTLNQFYIYDSFLGSGENGEGVTEKYVSFDADWQAFNRTFIVLYPQEREARVREVLGVLAEESGAAEVALQVAQQEARANPQNSFAWFNMGTAFVYLGRYEEAAATFDQARNVGTLPWRMMWYQFGPYQAYYETGRYNEILSLAASSINTEGDIEETYYWQGMAYKGLGETENARQAFRNAINRNSRYTAAQQELDALG